MAADVGYLVRILNEYNEEQQRKQQVMSNSNSTDQTGKSRVLVTRDLLGGGGNGGGGGGGDGSFSSSTKLGFQELDFDSKVPNGWEKRLDMKSGKIYLQRCNSEKSSSSSSSDHHHHQDQNHKKKQSKMIPELQDLNFPPSPTTTTTTTTTTRNLLKPKEEEDQNLDLKLVFPSDYDFLHHQMMSTTSTSSSVCTLDKVKSALERAEKESSSYLPFLRLKKKRSISISTENNDNGGGRTSISSSSCSSYSSPSSSSSNLMKKQDEAEEKKMKILSQGSGFLFAAGCPGCLSYVLISKMNPKCPRCESIIPFPPCSTPPKKPRIDLNISI